MSLSKVMEAMPVEWRYYWCGSKICGCLGCANNSGRLASAGYTREDWAKWVEQNPQTKKVKR
tara:strand:- start:79360 stop:79545 length:186 start_codon:yes stop_codon:yes gene_type:complete